MSTVQVIPDFVASHADFQNWAHGRKQLRMEYFHPEMRRNTGLLIADGQPEGGKSNYESENRKPAKGDLVMSQLLRNSPDAVTDEVLDHVDTHFANHFGTLRPFWCAVTRDVALVDRIQQNEPCGRHGMAYILYYFEPVAQMVRGIHPSRSIH
jgi:deoxyribodipyrimidine photolyase-related protein